ncbi:MAG: hypothetical protein WCK89_13095 [bacterium]
MTTSTTTTGRSTAAGLGFNAAQLDIIARIILPAFDSIAAYILEQASIAISYATYHEHGALCSAMSLSKLDEMDPGLQLVISTHARYILSHENHRVCLREFQARIVADIVAILDASAQAKKLEAAHAASNEVPGEEKEERSTMFRSEQERLLQKYRRDHDDPVTEREMWLEAREAAMADVVGDYQMDPEGVSAVSVSDDEIACDAEALGIEPNSDLREAVEYALADRFLAEYAALVLSQDPGQKVLSRDPAQDGLGPRPPEPQVITALISHARTETTRTLGLQLAAGVEVLTGKMTNTQQREVALYLDELESVGVIIDKGPGGKLYVWPWLGKEKKERV